MSDCVLANNAPRVSVLMPVYNTGDYLREALDSILSQTYKDFELIVLDDCSPDNSAAILDSYDDPRIVRYRGSENVGLANVLNIGMKMANGEFIARMDSDDLSLPERLKIQVDYLDAHPDIDLISVGMKMFGQSNRVWSHPESVDYVKFTAMFYSPILHASSMWRKKSFTDSNLFFRQEMVPAEDYDMWVRALVKGLKLINIPDVLYMYRIRAGQATSTPENARKFFPSIHENYFRGAFPNADDNQLSEMLSVCKFHKSKRTWNRLSTLLEKLNKENSFMDSGYLHVQMKRCFQDKLYWHMRRNGLSWQLVWLRRRQVTDLLKRHFQNKLVK